MTRIVLFSMIPLLLLPIACATSPRAVVAMARRQAPDVVFRVALDERVVALTIDDGPSTATPEILDVLDAHGVRATFFVIGEHVRAHPDLARRIREEGHELAHHMMRDEPSISLPDTAFVRDFEEMDALLREIGGGRLYRPGSGWFDRRMVEEVGRRGYRTILGSVYPFDAQLPFPRFAGWFIRWQTSPGAILVLHDGPDRGARTAEVLRRVLPELRRQGFEVVPASELLAR
jgi:peptidoglycan-N-acetylglucosamine deacetylase